MRTTPQSLTDKIKQLRYFEKLIALNVTLFVFNHLITFFAGLPRDFFFKYLELPKSLGAFLMQPWSMLTYAFVHYDFMHLFWNMLLLFFVGRLFVDYFGQRNFLPVYFLGAFSGGLFFWVSYNLFPVFLEVDSSLVGASAAIMAVLIYTCTYLPKTEVQLIFFRVPLAYIGIGFVLIDLVQLPQSNPGGHLAHLGGALLGFTLAYNLIKTTGSWYKLDLLKKMRAKHAKLHSVYKNEEAFRGAPRTNGMSKSEKQQKIDEILDKISQSGYDSLSKDEKDFLFRSGDDI
ncbi:MAG: rhomboid family intramembrane serine protease [Bacteroidetes bacterium]|nr:rhomboid family intramembrane serine protease [Bacteroidota bacterium]